MTVVMRCGEEGIWAAVPGCWGRWVKPFKSEDLQYFTLLGERILGHRDSTLNQSELRFYLAVHVRYWVLSFCESGKALGSPVLGAENGPTWPCSAGEGSGNHHPAKKKWVHLKSLWSVQPRKDCQDRYWQINKSNSKEKGNKCLCLEEKEQ